MFSEAVQPGEVSAEGPAAAPSERLLHAPNSISFSPLASRNCRPIFVCFPALAFFKIRVFSAPNMISKVRGTDPVGETCRVFV